VSHGAQAVDVAGCVVEFAQFLEEDFAQTPALASVEKDSETELM
jgi:hypothetical protein